MNKKLHKVAHDTWGIILDGEVYILQGRIARNLTNIMDTKKALEEVLLVKENIKYAHEEFERYYLSAFDEEKYIDFIMKTNAVIGMNEISLFSYEFILKIGL